MRISEHNVDMIIAMIGHDCLPADVVADIIGIPEKDVLEVVKEIGIIPGDY